MNKILAKMRAAQGVASAFGFRAAYVTQFEFHLAPTSKKEAYFLRKHDFVTDLLQTELQSVICSFEQTDWSSRPPQNEERLIWIFWWQGRDAMPDVVKMCYESVRLHAEGRARVILLSKDNFADYVVLPNFVMKKLNAGFISIAQFTDILRVHLVHQHGGLWLDATVYVSQKMPDAIFAPFFTIRHQPIVSYAALGRWTGFALGGQKNNALFAFLSTSICKYWERKNLLIDYYLLDYLINLADRRFSAARELIESNAWTDDGLFELASALNKEHDEEELEKVLARSVFHKLSWKALRRLKTEDGVETNFAILKRRRAAPT